MKIIKEVFYQLFISTEPIFRLDSQRYLKHLFEEFPELSNVMDASKLRHGGFKADQQNLRQDVANVCSDFNRAIRIYKKEKLGYGKSQQKNTGK